MPKPRLASHLHTSRHGIYGFRIVVPLDLRDRFPQREYRVSMHTRDASDAARRAYRLSYALETNFERIRTVDFDEGVALGRSLLEALKAESADEQIAVLRGATKVNGDERLPALVERHIALLTQMRELQEQLDLRVRGFISAVATAPEVDTDGMAADVFAELGDLKARQARVFAESVANLHDIQAVAGAIDLEEQESALKATFASEREVNI